MESAIKVVILGRASAVSMRCSENRFQIVTDWLITLVFKRDTSKLT